MPSNSNTKSKNRVYAAERGISYTAAMRERGAGETRCGITGIGGKLWGPEGTVYSRSESAIGQVRMDLYAVAAYRTTDEFKKTEAHVAAYLTVARKLLSLHPAAAFYADDAERRQTLREYGFSRVNQRMLNSVYLPYVNGGNLEVDLFSQTIDGKLTFDVEVQWVGAPEDELDDEAGETDDLFTAAADSIHALAVDTYRAAHRDAKLRAPAANELKIHRTGEDRYSFYWDYIEAVWAVDRGLTRAKNPTCLCRIGGRKTATHNDDYSELGCSTTGAIHLKDHRRVYLARDPKTHRKVPAVITWAPYPRGNSFDIPAEVKALAETYDLSYRVGEERDYTYGHESISIVLWNPRVIDLP